MQKIKGTLGAKKFIADGGTSSEFLKADGSLDSSVYFKLDQTTPQTIINGIPTFNLGLKSKYIYDSSGNLIIDVDDGVINDLNNLPTITFEKRSLQDYFGNDAFDWSDATAPIFSGLTTDGFLKTSSSDGTLIVDTNTYLSVAVTSVSAGNGMNFTTIAGTGAVTLGTPSNVSLSSTNSVTTNSHTHALNISTPFTTDTSAAGVWTSNLALGTRHKVQLTSGSQTLSFSGQTDGATYIFEVQQPSGGAAGTLDFTAFPYSYAYGVAPVLSATNSIYDIIIMVWDNGASKFRISQAGFYS